MSTPPLVRAADRAVVRRKELGDQRMDTRDTGATADANGNGDTRDMRPIADTDDGGTAGAALARLIAEEIVTRGPMPFARYMALALYHPRYGYYAGGSEPLGWAGDYITSGDVHPLWGRMLARQLHEMWEVMGRPCPFDVVEPGAGRGLLAAAVWSYARVEAPEWAAALRYTLADRAPANAPVRALREERLAQAVAPLDLPPGGLRWVADLADTFASHSLVGAIVSNELIDALPVHVVRVIDGQLQEMYVTLDARGSRLVETFGPPSSPGVADYLDRYGVPWRTYPSGWRAEINLAAEDWMRRVGPLLRRGFFLTIDYGNTARRLYTCDRRLGTLAVYSRHRFGEDPLAEPGQRDLTAHVNFTALQRVGREAGLRAAGFTTQANFLTCLGIQESLRALMRGEARWLGTRSAVSGSLAYLRAASERAAVNVLLDPRGMGGFQVLLQHRGLPGCGSHLRGFAIHPAAPAQGHGGARWHATGEETSGESPGETR